MELGKKKKKNELPDEIWDLMNYSAITASCEWRARERETMEMK